MTDPNAHQKFILNKGRLYYKERLVVPKDSSKIPLNLMEFHDSVGGGHSWYFRTYKRISGLFFWEGMKKKIQQYVQGCEGCQRNKYQALSPAGLLQPLPIPSHTWSDISMDFIGGLPKTSGLDTILIVVDRLTKYAYFNALTHHSTPKDVAEIFLKVLRLHGFPASIVSDWDRVFVSFF